MGNYKVVQGDICNANVSVICHQVNCQGVMGSGVAKAIRNMYPKVFTEYKQFCELNKNSLLGKAQFVEIGTKAPYFCCNMFAQDNYGYDGNQYTSLEAFKECLEQINRICVGCTVAFPWKIGCVRGGANWDEVLPLITDTLKDVMDIYFYKID